eukprot:933651-Amphidinium_carterae.1
MVQTSVPPSAATPEVVLLPGDRILAPIPENEVPASDLPAEPEPPPSTAVSDNPMEALDDAASSGVSANAPRRSWQSMSGGERRDSLRDLERLPECLRGQDTAARLESGERPTVRQRVEEYENRQSLWTRPCNNDNDTDDDNDDEDTLMGEERSKHVFIPNSVEVNWRKATAAEKEEFLKPGGSDESEWR